MNILCLNIFLDILLHQNRIHDPILAWPGGDSGLSFVSLEDSALRHDVSPHKVPVGRVAGDGFDRRLNRFFCCRIKKVHGVGAEHADLAAAALGSDVHPLQFTELGISWGAANLKLPLLSGSDISCSSRLLSCSVLDNDHTSLGKVVIYKGCGGRKFK